MQSLGWCGVKEIVGPLFCLDDDFGPFKLNLLVDPCCGGETRVSCCGDTCCEFVSSVDSVVVEGEF